jgi:hypothetical protein
MALMLLGREVTVLFENALCFFGNVYNDPSFISVATLKQPNQLVVIRAVPGEDQIFCEKIVCRNFERVGQYQKGLDT